MVNRAKTDTWVTLMGVVEVNWGKSLLPEHRQTPRLAKCSPALCRWKWPGAGWPCMELGFPPQLSAWHDSTVTGSPLRVRFCSWVRNVFAPAGCSHEGGSE